MAGALFESLVTLGVRSLAQAAEARVSHLRTEGGNREIDLIIEGPEGQILGIEVKLAPDVNDSDIMPDRVVDLVVVTTGSSAYRRSDGIAVVPLALLGH